ncbi:ABC transporter permease [bacterium]|nr:ABC transporter permease [bacterium]
MSGKIVAVIKREFLSRAKTKGFIIGTFMFPLVLVLIFSGIFIFGELFKPSTKVYGIIDQTGRLYSEFTDIQSDTLKSGEPKYRFFQVSAEPAGLEAAMNDLKQKAMSEEIHGYMVIPEDVVESRVVYYSARNVSDFEEQESFERSFSWIVTNMRLADEGLPVERIRSAMARGRVSLKSRQVTEEGEVEKSGGASFALSYILTYVIILMIMIYGMIAMRSVIEEKSQRITETIVSSIKPFELMIGKIIGICGLGLTQMFVFGGFLLLIIGYAGPIFARLGVNVPEVATFISTIHFTPTVFMFMILFFLLGFVLYSSIFAAIGAIVNTEDEGQQMQGPLMILIWLGFFIMMAVSKNPETPQAFWVSLFPLYTPIVMFSRIVVSDPILPSGAVLSLFTTVATIVVLIWAVAKIYRVGILMYGKKPSFREALKWLKYK